MTSAPADLLEVQAYAHTQTGQPWASLGIVHSTPQGGGYHEGEDLLIQAGTAPGPQYPGDDYSYTDAPARDLLPTGRLAGGNYASAFDFGGDFPRFLAFNAWMRARMLANDPRTRDIREMIYTLDGHTVRRIDRTGVQGDSGDSSHLSHTHFSFFRDSVGRRSRPDNFLGLMREFFEGAAPAPQEDDMALDDIVTLADGRTKVLRDLLADLEQFRNAWIGDGALPKGFPKPDSPMARLLAAADRPAGQVTLLPEDRAAIVTELRGMLLADLQPLVALAKKLES